MLGFKNRYIVLLILLVGTWLRFSAFPDWQYHHDELSALLRTRFTDFSTLIAQGVWVDGHPALTQIWLWIWTNWFGHDPVVVKLPFVLIGIASIGLMYLLARELFSKKVAWIASSLFAVLQYGVTYSLWARPYAPGLFFVLLAFYFLVVFTWSQRRLNLLGFAISAALAGYLHYFALLQVVVVSVLWAAIYLRGRALGYFLLAALVAFGFWLPHLHITLHHLALGGIGDWLQKPSGDYWRHLLGYSFHYSWLLVFPLLIAAFGALLKRSSNGELLRKQFILLGAWLIPYIITWIYSNAVSALMHEGTMLFIFPMLVLFSSGFFQVLHQTIAKVTVVWILIFGSHTLLIDRFHNELNATTEYHDPVNWQEELQNQKTGQRVLYVDLRADVVQLMQEKGIADYSDVKLIEPLWQEQQWADELRSNEDEEILVVMTAASKPEYLGNALSHYPVIKAMHRYHSSTCYLLGKANAGEALEWNNDISQNELNRSEFSPVLDKSVALESGKNQLLIEAVLEAENREGIQLVVEGNFSGGLFWRSIAWSEVGGEGMATTIDLRDLLGADELSQLRVYVWNPEKNLLSLKELRIRRVASNPLRYGLFQPIQYPVIEKQAE